MKKIKRYTIRGIIGFVALLLLIWLGLSVYLFYNKKGLIEKVRVALNKQVKGKVVIGDISTEVVRTFPILTIRLSDVSVRDSLYSIHKREFISAKDVFVRVNFTSLLSGKLEPGKITFNNAILYLYKDSLGYSNLVRADNPDNNDEKKRHVPDLEFRNSRFTIENVMRHKLHDIKVERLFLDIDEEDTSNIVDVNLKSVVQGLTFNPEKGSYLKNKSVEGKFKVSLNKGVLNIPGARLRIDDHPYLLNARFYLKEEHRLFFLALQTSDVPFERVADILTQNIKVKLDSILVDKPVSLQARIIGQMKHKYIPQVNINLQANDVALKTPAIELNKSTFTAHFTNEIKNGETRTDDNSRITINDFKGSWGTFPLTSKQIMISDLKNPFVECDLQSDFQLPDINSISESQTIRFNKGVGKMDIKFKGSVANDDTIPPVMNGYIRFNNTDINYLPRDFTLTNCEGQLLFKHHDLFIPRLNAHAGNTFLKMKGDIHNFLAMVNIHPEKLVLNWQVNTDRLNVQDFTNFIKGNKPATVVKKVKSSGKNLGNVSGNVDKMLKDGVANIDLAAGNVLYKKFTATNVKAALSLLTNKILLKQASLLHAGGSMNFSGSMTDHGSANHLVMQSNLNNIDIPQIFKAFNNFGQDAITTQNMRGQLQAKVNLNTMVNRDAELITNTLKSTVDFSVKNGELLNFEPVMKISEVAFKKRDFSKMRFAELTSTIKVSGTAIWLDKMEIRSNVIKLFVEGVYDPENKTDMSIQVPLTNISKDESEELKNKGRAGLNIRLRARTGDDGKLAISWDPLNKAGKEREKLIEEKNMKE